MTNYSEISKIVDKFIESANEVHGYAYVAGALGSMLSNAILVATGEDQKQLIRDVVNMQRIMDERIKKVA